MQRHTLAALALAGLAAGGCFGPAPGPAAALAPEQPPARAEIGRWAGIDVGSKGVKPIVMTFVQTPDGWDFETDTTIESKNTDLGTPNADGGLDPARLAATAAAIAEMDKAIREKNDKLPPERMRVVVSSGVLSRVKDKDAARKELTAAVEKAIGRPPEYIDERQEAEFAARAIISPARRADRMVIDVGSGNTKFGWFAGGKFQNATLDTGTKAFRDAAAQRAGEKKVPFADAAAELRGPVLTDPLKKVAGAAGLEKITDVQFVGGAPWAAATLTHPGAGKDTRVPLSGADLAAFADLARLDPKEVRDRVLKAVADPAAQEAAGREVERVQKVFSSDELQAAAEILRAVAGELKLAGKKVVFFHKGQHAWIAGYLMDQAKLPE